MGAAYANLLKCAKTFTNKATGLIFVALNKRFSYLMSELKKEENLALRVVVMPRDLNTHATLFGGAMLAYIDQAGATVALRRSRSRVVLASLKEANFVAAAQSGDRLSFYAEITHVGRTSMTVNMECWREDCTDGHNELASTATAVYVAIDDNQNPIEVNR